MGKIGRGSQMGTYTKTDWPTNGVQFLSHKGMRNSPH
jgi:hypothetical protein